ncbi:hypothetical protein JB92DRAFT_2968861 [Gautieria morchelliformis]|nr:hypothetical protein JB92DRAFT_2968861 [Gautieria morchelliformis]
MPAKCEKREMAPRRKPHQGPIFPYRFSFDQSKLRVCDRPGDLHYSETFCRWTTGTEGPPRALEWSEQGKGKGPTALSTDEPPRCCSECTPLFFLTDRADDSSGTPAPGGVFVGFIAGHGWYSSPVGTEFLIRLVTVPDEVAQLRDEARFYEDYETKCSGHPVPTKEAVSPLEFHGFFKSDVSSSAAIVLRSRWGKSANQTTVGKGKKKTRRSMDVRV